MNLDDVRKERARERVERGPRGEVHEAALDSPPPDQPLPLPGELGIPNVAEATHSTMSRKGLLALGLLVVSLIAVAGVSITRFAASRKKPDDGIAKRVADRPAASGELHRLDLTPVAASAASNSVRS